MVVYGAYTGLKRPLWGGWGVTPQLDGVGSDPEEEPCSKPQQNLQASMQESWLLQEDK